MMIKLTSPAWVMISTLLLAACGSSNGGKTTDSSSPSAPITSSEMSSSSSAITYDITGNITGLMDNVTLSVGSDAHAITRNGAFSINEAIGKGENADLQITSNSAEWDCAFVGPSYFENVNNDLIDIDIFCAPIRTLQVRVQNYFNGEALSGAAITVSWLGRDGTTTLMTTTDSSGLAEVSSILFEDRVNISTNADGYGSAAVIVLDNTGNSTATISVQPVSTSQLFNAAEPVDIVVDGDVVMTLPANALVDMAGEIYDGEVTTKVTVIDPGAAPELMPGNYQSINEASGTIRPIESFGAIDTQFYDAAGNALALAPSAAATLRIPVSSASSPLQRVPLYRYDSAQGYWIEDGEAELTDDNGTLFYVGEVDELAVWNADYAYTSVLVSGCVTDAQANPLSHIAIQAQGKDYIGLSDIISDTNGNFSLPVKAEAELILSARNGGQSRTLSISTTTQDLTLDGCLVVEPAIATVRLTWGEDPLDLDSYFHGPESDPFILSFFNDTVTTSGVTVFLDVDDVTSFGPEIVTIPQFPVPGTYRYLVHHYNGDSNIKASPARVEINLAGFVTIFEPPAGEPSLCWDVFQFVVSDEGEVTVEAVQKWVGESYCEFLTSFDSPLE